ncbi:MAG: hypothetical protein HQ515_23850 [Phycisphaeraceae bacterium]|nr:hypothetical protein [Phycisphaeraceae bacterium]
MKHRALNLVVLMLAVLLTWPSTTLAQSTSRIDLSLLGPFTGAPQGFHTFSDGRMFGFNEHSPNYFESVDNGISWTVGQHGFPHNLKLAGVVQTANGTVFAPGSLEELHLSWNGGRDWLPYGNHLGLAPFMIPSSLREGSPNGLYITGLDPTSRLSSLFKLNDQGTRWEMVSVIPEMFSVQLMDVGGQGQIIIAYGFSDTAAWTVYSSDGGATWAVQELGLVFAVDVRILADGSALLVSGSVERLDPSTLKWENTFVQDVSNDALVLDDGSLLLAGSVGVIRSEDHGVTWAPTGLAQEWAFDLELAGNGDILAATVETVYRSTDKGLTWTPSAGGIAFDGVWAISRSSNGEMLFDANKAIHRLDANDATNAPVILEFAEPGSAEEILSRPSGDYLMTTGGSVYFRASGQELWVTLREDSGRKWAFDVSHDGQTIVISGTQNYWVSPDGGTTWTNQWDNIPTTRFNCWSAAIGANGDLFAGMETGLFLSTDGGTAWQKLTDLEMTQVYPLASGEIVAAGSELVYLSTDGGVTFAQVDYPVGDRPLETFVEMPDGTLYSSICSGLQRSNDGGRSWTAQATWGHICATDMHIDPDGTLWLSAWDTGLYRSETSIFDEDLPGQ